jgi:acyl-CoA synthetase (AMP-forming)/AMP-acid ligase II
MESLASRADPLRRVLDAAVLEWMRAGSWQRDDARFEALALELFRFQFEHCGPYQSFCRARGAEPGSVSSWREIPPVPSGAFRETALRSFDDRATCKVFRTSGTTGARRGELHLDTLELYEASLAPTIGRFVFPDLRDPACESSVHPKVDSASGPDEGGERIAIRVLAPSPNEAPDSSLSHMFGVALTRWGSAGSGWDVAAGQLGAPGLLEYLEHSCDGELPVVLCGTSFAFVHLLDAMAARAASGSRLELAAGSRIMETGGFKGQSREIPRDELYAALEDRLGVPQRRIVNQYGMTELGSQFYDSVLREDAGAEPSAGRRRKLGPPWARVRILDPETGTDAKRGAVGMIAIHDLANTGSVAAILTADLGRFSEGQGEDEDEGFEVLGRAAASEERGCSIAADAMLESRTRSAQAPSRLP